MDILVRYQLKFQEDVPSLDDAYFVTILLVLAKRIFILDENWCITGNFVMMDKQPKL